MNRRSKTALSLMLALTALLALPCRASSAEDERLTLMLLSFPDQPKQSLMQVLERANLPFDVSIVEVPQNQYEQKVRMKLFSGEAPDLVLIDTPNIASYAATGALEPLDAYWDADDFGDLVDSSRQAPDAVPGLLQRRDQQPHVFQSGVQKGHWPHPQRISQTPWHPLTALPGLGSAPRSERKTRSANSIVPSNLSPKVDVCLLVC